MLKGQNPKFLPPLHLKHFGPQLFLHFRWKIKIWDKISVWLVNRFLKWLHCTKTHKLVCVLVNGPFPDQGPGGGAHGASSLTQQYNFFAEQSLKISVCFMQLIKSYSIFTARQTDAWARFFSKWKFIPFTKLHSFVCFALLTHSLTHSLCLWRINKKRSGFGPFEIDCWVVITRPI